MTRADVCVVVAGIASSVMATEVARHTKSGKPFREKKQIAFWHKRNPVKTEMEQKPPLVEQKYLPEEVFYVREKGVKLFCFIAYDNL